MLDDDPRPAPNGGVLYVPTHPGGFHFITGRAAWVVWQASVQRDRRWAKLERSPLRWIDRLVDRFIDWESRA